jgi:glycosyltransferase involved in cell wall biosynthesis
MTPKISIIMSTFNDEKFVAESIESILNQTFKDFEFIIINDCSTDNTLNVIKSYQEKDDRIILINNEKNL